MNKLSVVVICRSPNFSDSFLKSINFADEIIAVCTDPIKNSKNINQKIKVHHTSFDKGFSGLRNYGLKKSTGDWVFQVDTDEVVSTQLASEIKEKILNNNFDGFFVRRIDTCYHEVQLHGEVGNTKILRLAKRKSGKFVRPVHEYWKIDGKIGELVNPLYHSKDKFISEFLDRISVYGPIDAKALSKEGKHFSYLRLFVNPKAKFILNYFIKQGLRDGITGLFQSYLMSVQSLSVRVFQWTLQNQSTG